MKKGIVVLTSILILFVLIIIMLLFHIQNKATFKKPQFDKNVSTEIPNNLDYKSSIIDISDGYSIYIDGKPKLEKNNLIINFVSVKENNVWIKIRIIDSEKNVVAESGLIKPGEYLKNVKLNRTLETEEKITYLIMGYEMNSYFSAGTIKLNTKVGV